MLEAVPNGWFSNDYKIEQDGVPLVDFHRGWFNQQSTLTIQGVAYTIRREGKLGMGAFVLEANGEVLVRARKPSAFKRTFEIEYNNSLYMLCAQSTGERSFALQQGEQVVGTVRPKRAWSRKAFIDFPTLPLHVSMFLAWLVIILWQRDEAVSNAAMVSAG